MSCEGSDSKLADLVASLKKYTTENTGAVSGAMGAVTDTMVYGGGYSTDTITLSPSWNTTTGTTTTVDLSNALPNITISNGGYNFSNTTIGSNTGVFSVAGANWNNSASGQINLDGKNADIKINGKSLIDTLTALEERLNILTPNPKLEAEWDELRELGERYRELEKQCKEKAAMWEKLKSMPAPTIT